MEETPVKRGRDLIDMKPYALPALPPWIERWASIGIVTGDPQVARRQRFVNIGIAAAAANAASHFVINAVYDFGGLAVVNIYNLVFAFGVLLLPRLHCRGDHAAALALAAAILVGNSFVVWALGVASDLQIYFTLAGAWLFFFGPQNLRLFVPVFLAFAATLLFHLNFAPVDGFVLPEDGHLRDLLSTHAMINTIAINAAMIYYALWALRHAEMTLEREHARAEALLVTVMPFHVVERLKDAPQGRIADRFETLSVLFADLVGFTAATRGLPPETVVAYLDDLVRCFDALCERFGVDKIKTVGDGYMAAAGFDGRGAEGAAAVGRFAFAAMTAVSQAAPLGGRAPALRIGIHCGPATAGIIGDRRFSYDVWGEAVNIASRLETHGEPGRIHVSDAFRATAGDALRFVERGATELKGVGAMRTFFLTGDDDAEPACPLVP
jgi:adenylate cyclase